MKMQSEKLFDIIDKVQEENLTAMVNKMPATGLDDGDNKIFSTIDLWGIQQKGKSCTQRRHAF